MTEGSDPYPDEYIQCYLKTFVINYEMEPIYNAVGYGPSSVKCTRSV